MTFKEIVRNDAEAVFLNGDEFADEHEVDGEKMKIIIDNNEHLEREKRYRALEDGIHQKQVLFYVSAARFGRLPKIGRVLTLDGKQYKVTDAIREDGIYSISLEANNA